MNATRLHVRTTMALRALVDHAGPVGVATRALILLGASAAGFDLDHVLGDLHTLIGCQELAPGVRLALQRALEGRGATCGATYGATSGTTHSCSPERHNRPVPVVAQVDQTVPDTDTVDDQEPSVRTDDWVMDGLGDSEVDLI